MGSSMRLGVNIVSGFKALQVLLKMGIASGCVLERVERGQSRELTLFGVPQCNGQFDAVLVFVVD